MMGSQARALVRRVVATRRDEWMGLADGGAKLRKVDQTEGEGGADLIMAGRLAISSKEGAEATSK